MNSSHHRANEALTPVAPHLRVFQWHDNAQAEPQRGVVVPLEYAQMRCDRGERFVGAVIC